MSTAAVLRQCQEAERTTWRDPFGDSRVARLWHDWCDLRAHRKFRRAARHGYLRPPAARGRLLWIMAGASADSVLMAAGVAQAVRERRLDLQIVVTVEHEYPYFLERLSGLDRTAWGYAPDDCADALSRAWQRLSPWGVLTCAQAPRANLARRLADVPHYRHLPSDDAGDPLTLLVASQVDPNLRVALHGGTTRNLWWRHMACAEEVDTFVRVWRARFPDDLLCLSGLDAASVRDDFLRLSAWDRTPPAAGTVMWLDDPRWLPAVAAASTAAHLADAPRWVAWQALAGGAAISGEAAPLPLLPRADVLAHWGALASDPILARSSADACRRGFWQARRCAEARMSALLDEIFGWN